jgi:hypothetical protein
MATARANAAYLMAQDREQAMARKAEAARLLPEPDTAWTPAVRAFIQGLRNDEVFERKVQLVHAVLLNPKAKAEVLQHGAALAAEFWSYSEKAEVRIAVENGVSFPGRTR